MYCVACKTYIAEHSKFCGSCGAKQGATNQSAKTLENTHPSSMIRREQKDAHPALNTLFVTTDEFAETLKNLLYEVNGYKSNIISIPGNNHQELANQCRLNFNQYSSICIVGGFGDISPFQVPNPSSSADDPDEWCFTDSIFGCHSFDEDDVETAIPTVVVSRIPILDENTIRNLLADIELNGRLHEQFCFGVTAELWRPATAKIFEETGLNKSALFSTPDWEEKSISVKINEILSPNKARVYLFNVHGGADSTEWVGDSRERRFEPIALSPVALKEMSDSILISEACYGGAMQYEERSIVEQFFYANGKAFVGCSVVAYGNPGYEEMPLFSADVIALSLMKNLSQGMPLGESLKAAKKETLESALSSSQNETDMDTQMMGQYAAKAILSFNAFGCPWLKFSDTSSEATVGAQTVTDSSTSTPSSTSERLNDIRSRLNSRIQSRTQNINQRLSPVRNSYRTKLPIKNQLFLLSMDESLAALRSFRDFDKIKNFFSSKQISVENCNIYKSKKSSVSGYLISASRNDPRGFRGESYAMITNGRGELKIILGSK